MTRKAVAILLLIAFSMQVFHHGFIFLDYYVNTATYARNCENKLQPTKHCKGKCQMFKKLKAEEKKDQQNPDRRTGNRNEFASSKSSFPTLPDIEVSISTFAKSINHTSYPKGISPAIFHPPA